MKNILICIIVFFFNTCIIGQQFTVTKAKSDNIDYITALKDTLYQLSENSENIYFKIHCTSMIDVIESYYPYSSTDSSFLKSIYYAFNNETDTCSAKNLNSYLTRARSFILSWTSSSDHTISFSWLKPPVNWDPDKVYPLYIQLHGYWDVASNPLEYLSYPFINDPSASFAFEDGYLLSPWGRGNLWYRGIAETDIWECMAALENIVHTDSSRKYICGHSMGGSGAWYIAHRSVETWAAIGIHAGAIWYDQQNEVTTQVVDKLKNLPVYFVCGDSDDNLNINQTAYQMLNNAGNENLAFVTFQGGHDYRQEDVEAMYKWMRNFKNVDTIVAGNTRFNATPGNVQLEIYLNPLNESIDIKYSLPVKENISLIIYNISGQQIETIAEETQEAGDHKISWKTKNLVQGIYFCRLAAGNTIISKILIYQ